MNTRFKTLSLALAAAMALGLTACAPPSEKEDKAQAAKSQDAQVEPLNKVQTLVSISSNNSYRAIKTFDVTGYNDIKGVIIEPVAGGPQKLGWTNTAGEFFIPGEFYNSEGLMINSAMLHKFGETKAGGAAQAPAAGPQAKYTTPTAVADAIANQGFVAGTKGPIVTAFFEPYCGYCNQLFERLAPKIDAGELRVRFIMVSFLSPDSAGHAADITNARNPYEALKKWESVKDKHSAGQSSASDKQKEQIAKNSTLMNDAGMGGTPALVFCNTKGEVQTLSGMPQDFEGFLNNLGSTGHPSCSTK